MVNPMDLTNKKIIVTGASSGIGKETSILLSKLGAQVLMIARREDKLKETLDKLEGINHRYYCFDLKKIESIEALINKIVKDNGPIDGLVYSAGISNMRPLKMTNYEFLHDMMLINFYSFIEIIRCVTKRDNYNRGMSIVSMSSISGIRGYKSKTAYSATKAALDGAIRSMAKELAEKRIRINSIVAGSIKTEMFERFLEKTGINEDDTQFNKYCLGLGESTDVANAIAFLLSDASKIITGTGLVVDSGATS